ncbi:MAG: hypothetical protein AAB639_00950 [Patescibacteria group bacterium]
MDIKILEDQLAKFIYDLETEDRLVRVGLKEVAETSKIYKKYQDLFTRQTIDEVHGEIESAKDSKKKDILERIYFTLAGSFIGQQLARLQDEVTTYFIKATVKVGTESLPYFQVLPMIAKEPQFARRETLDDAAEKVTTAACAKQKKILDTEIKLIKSLGFSGYVDYFARGKKTHYDKFFGQCLELVKATDKIWQSVSSAVVAEVLGRPFKRIRSCHTLYLRSLSMYDNFYPGKQIVSTFEKWVRDAGLSTLLTKIKIDDVARPRKNPRAVCYWPNPPSEIHLIIKPLGGEQDFESMFHEGGHALHGAAIDEKLPYSLRMLSRSNALTETYAFLLEDLVFNPDFLTTYLNVSAFTGAKIKWQAYFVNLMMLRRYLGKFIHEYEMFAQMRLPAGPTHYAKTLEKTTGFVHKKTNWLVDMDSGFYSAEYLRAWIAAAQIQDYLVGKFGKKWFVIRRAGEFLRKLYSRGVQDEVEDVVKRLGYKPWDVSLLLKGYKDILG